jgi:hypothetical protein
MPTTPELDEYSVAGQGVARLAVPRWARAARLATAAGAFGCVVAGAFRLNGWRWVMDGLTPGFAVIVAAVVTAGAAAAIATWRSGLLLAILALRRTKGELVYGGLTSWAQVVAAAAVPLTLLAGTAWCAASSARICPLPGSLVRTARQIPAPDQRRSLPVYLWDYATWIDPEWLDTVDLVLPYEKGPPQKLLPKIYFADARAHAVELELHGRRPRSYPRPEVEALFASGALHPGDWPLVWKLEREAGLALEGGPVPALYLLELGHDRGAAADNTAPTLAVGVPWDGIHKQGEGRLFFWGSDGSVFQVRCADPCGESAARVLERIRFPADPRGSAKERLEWTRRRIAKLLAAPVPPQDTTGRARYERTLTLYLVSMLTMDPRDPEAFFHIGKLAHNRETVLSALRYGRDVGLEQAKVFELEATAEKMER